MVKILKPTWMQGNIIAAFYDGNLWSNNILTINVATYNKTLEFDNQNLESAINFKLLNENKLVVSLKSKTGIIKSDEAEILFSDLDYHILEDEDYLIVKIAFDVPKNELNIKEGNYYYMIFFENSEKLKTDFTEHEIQIFKF